MQITHFESISRVEFNGGTQILIGLSIVADNDQFCTNIDSYESQTKENDSEHFYNKININFKKTPKMSS